MRTAIIKKVKVKNDILSDDVRNIFTSLTTNDPKHLDISIAWRTYREMRSKVAEIIQLLKSFSSLNLLKQYNAEMVPHMQVYVAKLDNLFSDTFNLPDLSRHVNQLDNLTIIRDHAAVDMNQFAEKYMKIKKSVLVNHIISIASHLSHYHKFINNKEELSDKFILDMPGVTWSFIPNLEEVNFKMIYENGELSTEDKHFLMLYLNRLYTNAKLIHKHVITPDIDIDKFAVFVEDVLEKIQKDIHGCDEAFRELKKSIAMLKDNFSDYYKVYMETDNSSIILENFILDVKNSTRNSSSSKLATQFVRIVNYLKKKSSGVRDKTLNTIFSELDRHTEELEKHVADSVDEEKEI